MGIPGATEIGILYVAYAFALAFINISFAVGVLLDTSRMKRTGGVTFLVPGFVWFLGTLIGGIFAVAIYWAIHHSALRSTKPPWISETNQ